MRRLPAAVQPFLTWLTGKPLYGSRARFRSTPWLRVFNAVVFLATGIALGAIGLGYGGAFWLLLPLSWLTITGAMRTLYLVISHHAAHENVARSRRVNRVLGEMITAVLLGTPFVQYRESHFQHHSSKLGTLDDDDVRALANLGLSPGLAEKELWQRLYWTGIFSPAYHARQFGQRLRANFWDAPISRRVLVAACQLGILGLASLTDNWKVWLVVWLPCQVVFSQVSLLLQTVCEHVWHVKPGSGGRRRDFLTVGRFFGERAPPADEGSRAGRAFAWVRWWTRVFTVYLPARIGVFIGDLPQHDLHHKNPRSDWANAAYVRQRELEAAPSGRYTEVWGTLRDQINAVFAVWGTLPPLTSEQWRYLETR
jgi:fatty acid desaturase